MSKPRFGWTHAAVPREDVRRLLDLVQKQLDMMLEADPLPAGYKVNALTVSYVNPKLSMDDPKERNYRDFSVMAWVDGDRYYLFEYRKEAA